MALKNELSLIIRPARDKDASEALEVFEMAFTPLTSIYRPKGNVKQHWRERSEKGSRLVAVIDDRIVGTIQYESHNGHLHIMGLAVHPDFQRTGIASQLVESVCNMALSLGHTIVRIDTIKETGNVIIFQKMGFTIVSESVATWCLSDDYEVVHDVIMDKQLTVER